MGMRQKGQALIVVVIIFALIMSVFAISISTAMRSNALEETEIYQREQDLYLAQMGINKMIYNINSGTTYTNGQYIAGTSPSGIGSYKATYITPDTSGFGGIATIKGEGTVGQFTRVIYSSLQGSGSAEVFKYCLYTSTGGKDSIGDPDTSYFLNPFGPSYFYNPTGSYTIPSPDWSWYTTAGNYQIKRDFSASTLYDPTSSTTNDTGKVVFINYTGNVSSATLTISFNSSIGLSVITNFPSITTTINGTWNSVNLSGLTYPILVHQTAYSDTQFNINLKSNRTLAINGFVYTNATFAASYSGQSNLTINGEMVANSLGDIADKIKFNYINDYFGKPPPHFIVSSSMEFLPSSYREEY
jgi:type II secretory pathway pseudopilin PulG